jgi:hypothetical protein
MLKQIKFAVLVLVTALFTVAFLSQQLRVKASQQTPRAEIVGIGASMNERLGADDKPVFAIHFTGELHGSLETCG